MASKIIVDQLEKTGGALTALTLPTGNASASQYLQNDGAGALSWATVTVPAAVTNTPYFYAYLSATQGFADNAWTKVQCNTVVAQTGSTYDNVTNFRWTPAVAGTYFILGQTEIAHAGGDAYILSARSSIYKNGAEHITIKLWQGLVSDTNTIGGPVSGVIVMNDTDYVELWGIMDDYSGTGQFVATNQSTHFMAYKLII